MGWGFLALLMLSTVFIDTAQFRGQQISYALSPRAETLLPSPNSTRGSSLQHDSSSGAYEYNKGYQPAGGVAGATPGPKFVATVASDLHAKGMTVTDPYSNMSIGITPLFPTRLGVQDRNRLTYPLIGRDGQNVYTFGSVGIKEDIVLNTASSDDLRLTYKLTLQTGTEARIEKNGDLAVYGVNPTLLGNVTTATDTDAKLLDAARKNSQKNTLLFTLPAPVVMEYGKKVSSVKVWFTLDGSTLELHAGGLKTASYPLTIDPSVYIETASRLMRGNNESNIDFDVDNELIQKSQTTGARIDSWTSTTNLTSAVWGQGTAVAGGYIYSVGGVGSASTVTTTYNTAGTNTYSVPSGVTKITVESWGGGGGGGGGTGGTGSGGTGGGGGYAKAVINVTPLEDLTVRVGAGGAKATGNGRGGSGGEASKVLRSTTVLLEAGAGGGGSGRRSNSGGTSGDGGAGGGTTGQAARPGSTGGAGQGGTQAAGGTGGTAGSGGAAGVTGASQGGGNGTPTAACATAATGTGSNGTGGAGGTFTTTCAPGGGGGGGYYGGGGGGSTSTTNRTGGGGGGGSSYANASAIVTGTDQLTVGSYQTPGNDTDSDRGGLADGGSGATTAASATNGDNGIVVVSYTTAGSVTDSVYWAKFNTTTNAIESPNPGTGACSGWCTNSVYDLPTALSNLSLVAYNGFLYAIGGATSGGTPQTTVYIAKIGANGEPQLWHPTGGTPAYWYSDTALSNARSQFAAVAYNNRMYILGGLTTSSTVLSSNTVQYANINPTGTLGTWTSTGMQALSGSSGGNRYGLTAHIYNDVLYAIGGDATFSGSPVTNVDYAKLNSDGTMNSWVQTSSLATSGRLTVGGSFSTIFGGYVYVAGGCTAVNASGYCTGIATDVQLASINADGSLAGWNTILGLTNDRFAHTLIAWQGGLYRLGGCRAQDATGGGCTDTVLDVDYGVINPDGEASTVATSVDSATAPCSTLNQTCSLPSASVGNMLNASAVVNGYLYIMGGCTSNDCTTYSSGVTYQAIGSDGTLQRPASCSGTYSNSYCVSPTSLPSARGAAGVAVFNNRIYLIGGFPTITNITYTTVNADGSIGSWSNTDFTDITTGGVDDDLSYTFAYARANPANAGSVPGNLFIFGGCTGTTSGIGCSSYSSSVYKCDLNTSGVPSNCNVSGQLQIGTVTGNDGLPTDGGLGAHAGAVYANYIYLMGGLSDSAGAGTNGTDLTYVRYAKFDDSNNVVAVSGSDWVEGSNQMNTGRRRGAGFGYNGFLYVLGGYDGADAIADIEFAKINVSDGSWGPFDTSSVSIQKRWALTTVVTNSYAYVIGGCTAGQAPSNCNTRTDTIQTFQIYNNDSGALQSVSSFSDDTFAADTDRWGASATILNGYIYVAGGCISTTDCTNATNNVQYAAISATNGSIGTWATASNVLPADRAWGKLVNAGGYLYYLGGQDDTATNEQSAVYYVGTFSSGNISAAWSTASGGIGDTASQAAQPRTKFGAAVWNDRIYVIGGLDGSAADTNTVYISPSLGSGGNIVADSWASDSDVPDVSRYGGALIAYANNLYYFGGNDGTNYLNDGQVSTIGYKTGTISQSGTTVTGSGTSWTSGMVGSKIQYPDGSTANITGYTSGTSLTVDASKTVTAGTIYTIQDGSVGAWTFTTSTPNAVSQADGFAANGYLYLVGGRSAASSCRPATLIAPISANTTIDTGNNPTGVGEWSQTNVRYAGGRYGAAVAYDEGKMYVMGGGCTSPQAGSYSTGTITQSSTTVTGSGTTWTDNYIGGTITYQDASTATIVSVTDSTHMVVSATKTIGSAQTYSIAVPRHVYGVLKSQPQVAIYSRMIDTDTDVFPTKWLVNGLDNSIGAQWSMKYSSAVETPNVVQHATFDEGTNGSTITTGTDSSSYDLCGVSGNGTLTYSNAQYITPGLSMRAATTSGTGSLADCEDTYTTTSERYDRFYVRIDSAPSSAFTLMSYWDSSTALSELRMTTGGAIGLRDNFATEATTGALTAGQWYRIEVAMVNDQMTVRTYTGANLHGSTPTDNLTITLDGTANNQFNNTRLGITSSLNANWGMYIDEHETSSSNWVGSVFPSWGQETNFGKVSLGVPSTYIPKDSSGANTNYARYYYMTLTIDSSRAFGYPEDVTRGPTIADLSLFYTADPSKRMLHGKTFTGGEQQPLDTPF